VRTRSSAKTPERFAPGDFRNPAHYTSESTELTANSELRPLDMGFASVQPQYAAVATRMSARTERKSKERLHLWFSSQLA
jgi:hypothetical protein